MVHWQEPTDAGRETSHSRALSDGGFILVAGSSMLSSQPSLLRSAHESVSDGLRMWVNVLLMTMVRLMRGVGDED